MRFRVLGSGSTGNATLVEGSGTRILIDAGLGPKILADKLVALEIEPASIETILVSHEHEDHARGAAPFSTKWGVRVAATRGTYAAAGFGGGEVAGFEVLTPGRHHSFGALDVEPVMVPHDAAEPVAFIVSCGDATFGHGTDFGHISARLASAFADCTSILLESNYDETLLDVGDYPWSLKERIRGPYGHLSNAMVSSYLGRKLGRHCRRVALAHLSQSNNTPTLALEAALRALVRGAREDVVVDVCAADGDGAGWVEVGPTPGPARSDVSQLRLF